MTQQEILEYNKRCAEFLGCVQRNYPSVIKSPFHGRSIWWSPTSSDGKTRTFYCEVGEEHFHDDWNWIMEVVKTIEKIKEVRDITITSTGCVIYHKEKPFSSHVENKKEAVVQAINQFLIWYSNEQN